MLMVTEFVFPSAADTENVSVWVVPPTNSLCAEFAV